MKVKVAPESTEQLESFEMIELASAELEIMAKAFRLIAEICAEDANDEQSSEIEIADNSLCIH